MKKTLFHSLCFLFAISSLFSIEHGFAQEFKSEHEKAQDAVAHLLGIKEVSKVIGRTQDGKECAVWGEKYRFQQTQTFFVHLEVENAGSIKGLTLSSCDGNGCSEAEVVRTQPYVVLNSLGDRGNYRHILTYKTDASGNPASIRIQIAKRYGDDIAGKNADVTCNF